MHVIFKYFMTLFYFPKYTMLLSIWNQAKKKPGDFNQFFWSGLGPGFQNEY